jgi:hypothetical protein
MRKILSVVMSTAILPLVYCLPSLAQAKWDVTRTMHIGGDGAWDYLTVDSQTHRLFVPRSTHTLVLDADSGKVLGDIPGQ